LSQKPIVQCGREISQEELDHIQSIVRQFSKLSLLELSCTICEHLNWFTASGGVKEQACMKLLQKLEADGLVKLPFYQKITRKKASPPKLTDKTAPRPPIHCSLRELGQVELVVADSQCDRQLFNEYVERYHYLGYKRPAGNRLRYFICAEDQVLGCLLIAGAAKALKSRDKWVGWSKDQRLLNLPWVVNNTRFVIFPWVKVPHLASHALGKLTQRVRSDCGYYWNYSPLLIETFVDPDYYQGTCYKAANWIHLGNTTGRGLKRPGESYQTRRKMIFVRPLTNNAQKQLCTIDLPQQQGDYHDSR